MHLNDRAKLSVIGDKASKVGFRTLGPTADCLKVRSTSRLFFLFALVINEEIAKTKTSFLTG